jgi:MSHA biogenesis protein MshK
MMKALIPFALAAACCTADAGSLPDPTRPLTFTPAEAVASSEPVLRLEAVMGSSDRPVAIVNGKLVRVGDRIDGMTIAAIDGDSVRYVSAGRERVARLASTSLKVRRVPEGVRP